MAGPGTSPSSWEREFHNVKLSKPASIPFLSDELMDGLPPDCSFKAFKRPQLRRCSFNLETIDWPRSRRIDGGLDGSILKIYFQGSDIPYCLKIVSRTLILKLPRTVRLGHLLTTLLSSGIRKQVLVGLHNLPLNENV